MRSTKTTVVILAAGIGSRYGAGIKQLAQIGPNGEVVMDYSIYDAKEAGFDKVVFIIRKDLEEEFKKVIGDRIAKHMEVEYVYQEIADVPQKYAELAAKREKPWGTGQAVLCCRNVVKEPFVVINADDYYGKEAFQKLHDFLVSGEDLGAALNMAMAGFSLKNTLSANGTATRGVCVEENHMLKNVYETYGIHADRDGRILCDDKEVQEWIVPESRVSMNMWAAPAKFIEYLETGFEEFLENLRGNAGKKEYLLPNIVDGQIRSGNAAVKVLGTSDKWLGITYREDRESVQEAFRELIETGVYPADLWEE